ncbi:hypothetical protein FKM82_018018 [Ascaphus truei]
MNTSDSLGALGRHLRGIKCACLEKWSTTQDSFHPLKTRQLHDEVHRKVSLWTIRERLEKTRRSIARYHSERKWHMQIQSC